MSSMSIDWTITHFDSLIGRISFASCGLHRIVKGAG